MLFEKKKNDDAYSINKLKCMDTGSFRLHLLHLYPGQFEIQCEQNYNFYIHPIENNIIIINKNIQNIKTRNLFSNYYNRYEQYEIYNYFQHLCTIKVNIMKFHTNYKINLHNHYQPFEFDLKLPKEIIIKIILYLI